MNKITYIAIMLLALASTTVVAQNRKKDTLSTKVVDVVKSYAPTIADAEKKREDAKVKDSLTVKKKQINYTINSVPVASTFVPDKGKAATVKQKVIRGDYQDSYIGGGFGMLNTFYADANITYNLNDNGKASFLLNHLSSSDEIEEVFPEMNYSNSSAEIRYDYQSQELLWGINADISRRLHNWYGIRENTFTRNQLRGKVDDMQQIYFDYGLAGYLQWANPYFKGLDFSFRGLSDHFESKELNVKAQPSFEIPLTDEQKINANVLVDYYDGSFTRKYNTINEINNRWMLFGINPSYQMDIDNLNLKLGVSLMYVDANKSGESKFKAYPDVEATYTFNENAILHAGIRGTLQQNTFEKLTKTNPYLAPIQEIKPTNVQADAFLGINGKVGNDLLYRLQGSYRQYKEMPLFTTFTETPTIASEILPYQYYNAFKAIYDDVSDFELLASIGGNLQDIVTFNFEGKYNSYAARNQREDTAWNLPNVRVSLYTDFKILPNLFAGFDLFYTGKRYDIDYQLTPAIPEKISLEGYFDLNLHADYTFNKHWQVFLKGNNLTSQHYKRWAYYPSQGVQIFAGIRYLFSLNN
nr:TonB-dependent receptor [uncultured Capnocytophaga sp.]